MHDAQTIDGLELKYNSLIRDLDERGRRRWAASEALALGYGGISAVSSATGLSHCTIRSGIRELRSDDPLPSGRQRGTGGGRKPLTRLGEGLLAYFDHKITSGPVEGTNNKIKTVQRQHCGIRDREYFDLLLYSLHEKKYALVG